MKTKEIRKFRENYSKYEKDCVFEGYRLAVLFDEKDAVKKYGGRWDADDQTWWMPEKNLKNDALPNGSLVVDVLNDEKMIMGQYGEYKGPCKGVATKYTLQNDERRYTVQWFEDEDAVCFSQGNYDNTEGAWIDKQQNWFTIEKARTRWNELTEEGYNRVENS